MASFQMLSVAAEAKALNSLDDHIRKYARSPNGNLEAFIQLDLQMYQNINKLLRPGVPQHKNGQARSLILRYLQDFNDTTYNSLRNGTNADEAVIKLSGSPLAVYRAFSRFENYIKKLLRHATEDLGAELGGKSS